MFPWDVYPFYSRDIIGNYYAFYWDERPLKKISSSLSFYGEFCLDIDWEKPDLSGDEMGSCLLFIIFGEILARLWSFLWHSPDGEWVFRILDPIKSRYKPNYFLFQLNYILLFVLIFNNKCVFFIDFWSIFRK